MTGVRQYTFLEDDLEKFAELIIRECIKKYNEYGIYSSDQRSFIIAGHNLERHFDLDRHD